jgi:ASC-1-like (ASCH) protein
MAIIKKKTWKEHFELVASGKKKFDLRLDDFDVKEGDVIILEEYDPKTKQYTGRTLEKRLNYVFKFKLNDFGQEKQIKEKGLQILQLD